jgi:DNA topoisomerase-2
MIKIKRIFFSSKNLLFQADQDPANVDKRASNYDYLVGLAIWKLSQEEKDKLLADSESKMNELKVLKGKSWSDLWNEDLEELTKAMIDKENKDKKELEECLKKAGEKLTKGGSEKGRKNEKRMSKGMFVS